MWNLSAPWWEFVLRGLIVYGAVLALLRVSGKRQIGQLTPFDLVLLLVISNAVQNAMNAGDNSVTAGLILAVTLVVANGVLGYVTWRSRKLEIFVEGRPQLLVHDGKVYQDIMRREHISFDDLNKALRHAGCNSVTDVHFAILETDGTVSVKMHERPPPTAPGTSIWKENNKDEAV
ncbi:DUF421 domain-containing protein [Cupriavidus pinatubonensis]|uniref:YetF C-terminal domain-containing protein n=1 Tax=Cupriavidus pinatubonensis TaxID=248026 RepID=A0ABM8WSZ8_9BURK|nr:YetF domain-containing protein [Cupriavidus pinatubonensis]CAG9170585.1 hypothetical protein LMG23994_01966 [Cupriavidus pinatubonensis]